MMNNLWILLIASFIASCSPTVKVATSDKPIEINMNIKIDHTIKVQIDKDVSKMIKDDEEGIF
jgi:hypothetical protein